MWIGCATASINIRTIVFSGPVMFAYGVILLILQRRGSRRFWWFAWLCFGFPILVVLIINVFSMSPDDAQFPIASLCCLVAVVCSVWISLVLMRRVDRPELDPAIEQYDQDGSGITLLS